MPLRRALLLPAAALACAGLPACGDGGGGGAATPSGPRSSLSADELLEQTAAALGRVRSYHMAGVSVDADGRSHYTGDTSADGRMRATYRDKDGTLSVIVIGLTTYVKGDARYWRRVGAAGVSARTFAGRWVKLPPALGAPLRSDVLRLLPKRQAYCLPKNLGTLSLDGTRTFKGRPVIVLRDEGERPGTTPSELWVAATGPAVPLRELQHGRQRPGGSFDPRCDDRDDDTLRSATTIGRYDRIRPIRPPKHFLDPGRLRGVPGGRSA